MAYAPTGPFTDAAAPGISAAFLNEVERFLSDEAATVTGVSAAVPVGTVVAYAGNTDVGTGGSVPTGWLECSGALVSRSEYADLFAKLGTAYGAGDGSTTFALPDMRGRFPVGAGGSYARGATGGADTVALTTSQMPSHTHSQPTHTHAVDPPSTATTSDTHTHSVDPPSTSTSTDSHDHSITGIASDGSTGSPSVNYNVTGHDKVKVERGMTSDSHSHTVNIASFTSGGDSHTHSVNIASFTSGSGGGDTTGSAGSGNSHENRPPYLALHFLVKAM